MRAYAIQSEEETLFKIAASSRCCFTATDEVEQGCLLAIQGIRLSSMGKSHFALLAIVEGTGEYEDSQKASRVVLRSLSETICASLLGASPLENNPTFADLLVDGIRWANSTLYQRNLYRQQRLGASLATVLVMDDTAYIVSIGMNHVYLHSQPCDSRRANGDLSCHSSLVAPVFTGDMAGKAVLGSSEVVSVEMVRVSFHSGNFIFLCSESLWKVIGDEDIRQIISFSTSDPSTTCDLLVQAAINRGGADTASVIAVHSPISALLLSTRCQKYEAPRDREEMRAGNPPQE